MQYTQKFADAHIAKPKLQVLSDQLFEILLSGGDACKLATRERSMSYTILLINEEIYRIESISQWDSHAIHVPPSERV